MICRSVPSSFLYPQIEACFRPNRKQVCLRTQLVFSDHIFAEIADRSVSTSYASNYTWIQGINEGPLRWFSFNIDHWKTLFPLVKSPNPRVLEIGSWEGRSAVFLLTQLCGKEGEIVRWSTKGDKFIVQSGSIIDIYSTVSLLAFLLEK